MATPPVARAEPDGYTIMTALPSLAVIPEGNRLAGGNGTTRVIVRDG